MNKYGIIIFCLVFNLIYFHFGLEPYGLSWNNIYKIDGDSKDYIQSVEYLLNGNGFVFFKTSNDTAFVSNFVNPNEFNLGIYYAFRSPGFAFFYFPLRWVFNQHYALIVFLFLQIIFTAIAKFYVAKIVELLTKSKLAFWLTLILINATPYFVQYNNLLLTEALGFSFLVFGIYLIIKYEIQKKHNTYLILSGLFLTIAFMLRPFLAVFPLAIALYLFIVHLPNIKISFRQSMYFVIPVVLITGTWTVRNYVYTQKFIPLASTIEFHSHKHLAYFEMMKFSKNHVISDRWFDKNSPVYWLITKEDTRNLLEIVPNLSTDDVTLIQQIKTNFHKSLDKEIDLAIRQNLEKSTCNSLKIINANYVSQNSKFSSFINSLKSTFVFLSPNNIRFFHSIKYPLNIVLVFIQSFVQILTLLIGVLISMILVFYLIRNNLAYLSILIPALFLIYYFGILDQTTESREVYTYAFLFLVSSILIIFEMRNFSKLNYLSIYAVIFFVTVYFAVNQTILEIKW